MKNLWKWSGTYLTWTGVIHTAVALVMGYGNYMPMLREGLVNSVGSSFERGFVLWFLVCGVLLLLLGPLLQHYLRVTRRPAPMWFGVALLVFSIVGGVIEPVSGFWLFVPQAVIIISANVCQRTKR